MQKLDECTRLVIRFSCYIVISPIVLFWFSFLWAFYPIMLLLFFAFKQGSIPPKEYWHFMTLQ